MTGIADLYLLIKRPNSKGPRAKASSILSQFVAGKKYDNTRFVVLSWKRTGSNLLCGILFNHPEITMHNELFNPIDIFSYYQRALLRNENGDRWNSLRRDLYPEAFLEHIWSGRDISGRPIKKASKCIGFKSFPDHWSEAQNDSAFQDCIMDDVKVKKIILYREDELAVYLSMKRAERTGYYMTLAYPKDLQIHVDPAAFQMFVNVYRETFRRTYRSPMKRQNTFHVSYEQLVQEEDFERNILPLLWDFLGVDNCQPLKKLRETVKQADPNEDFASVIDNYAELEFCFRHTDVKYFQLRKSLNKLSETQDTTQCESYIEAAILTEPFRGEQDALSAAGSWSLLLPICSRGKTNKFQPLQADDQGEKEEAMQQLFNANRLIDLAISSQYDDGTRGTDTAMCWEYLKNFGESLRSTASPAVLANTECLVGIDVDDPVFRGQENRIQELIPCAVRFFDIQRTMYGRLCKIWNFLAEQARNDYIVLLGDDIVLKDKGWQSKVHDKFRTIAKKKNLPFGAACVALCDESFPGFPTFPVVHRWHLNAFGSILPRQFVNQGGDPYLFELYSRFDAASFATDCRLENIIGGDADARYKKYEINWRGQILRLNLMHMCEYLKRGETGICVDIIVPSYRKRNNTILESIVRLKCSVSAYIRFWIVVDNPDKEHVRDVKALADRINKERFATEGNYFVTVLHYGENRGASYARNLGYNYSTADWALFIDDDVTPSNHLLDAYVGAISRYPKAKVFVGNTELPTAMNTWTRMLRTCNIVFFYGISQNVTFPPWGVTANIMVRGSRHNSTIQFKRDYPKTGGGEDIDLCFQFKKWYKKQGDRVVVGVPGATAFHPWWKGGGICYDQINGWAWGDSLCASQWPDKCFWAFPNWIEFIIFGLVPLGFKLTASACFLATLMVAASEHLLLTAKYYPSACRHVASGPWYRIFVACGAGTILSFQEVTRVVAHLTRGHFHCICRRFDWNDGQDRKVTLDTQLGSFIRFLLYSALTWVCVNVWDT